MISMNFYYVEIARIIILREDDGDQEDYDSSLCTAHYVISCVCVNAGSSLM